MLMLNYVKEEREGEMKGTKNKRKTRQEKREREEEEKVKEEKKKAYSFLWSQHPKWQCCRYWKTCCVYKIIKLVLLAGCCVNGG